MKKNVKSVVLVVLVVLVFTILISVVFRGCAPNVEDSSNPTTVTDVNDNGQNSTEGTNEDTSEGTKPTEGTNSTNPTDPTTPTTGEEGTNPTDTPVSNSLKLNFNSVRLEVGDIAELSVTYTGNGTLTWNSSNPAVATVNNNGKVTAKSTGNTDVSVTDGEFTVVCRVSVEMQNTLDYKFDVSPKNLTLYMNEYGNIQVTYTGTGSLVWASSNTKVATVTSNGKVTPKSVGKTTISVTDGVRTVSCEVIIKEAKENTAPVQVTLTLSSTSLSMKTGDTTTLTAKYNGTKALSWSSLNPDIATVSSNGVVTAKSAGKATIAVTDGVYSATCSVSVTNKTAPVVVTLTVNRSNLSLMVGESSTLTASYNGTKTLSWSSSNTKVATVVNGKVTAVGAGNATIIVSDGSKSATCDVTVTAPVVAVDFVINTPNNTKLYVGDSLQLDYTYTGDKSKLVWTSYMPDKATVDGNGKVTAIAVGNACINVSDGKTNRRINIDVIERKVAPEFAEKSTSIEYWAYNAPFFSGIVKYAGDSMTFKAATRSTKSNPDIDVISSDKGVVTASWYRDDSNVNHVTLNFKGAGTTNITIKSADGAVSETYSITVKSGYDFNPGSGQLTPEQWADCCTRVMVANGFNKDTTLGSYRVLTLSASELTFSRAQSIGQGLVHEWYINGKRWCWISYEGTNENGDHVFWTRWG